MNEHTPRSASVLLSRALEHVHLVQPTAARDPIRLMLRAGIEQCALSSSLLGKSMNHVLGSCSGTR